MSAVPGNIIAATRMIAPTTRAATNRRCPLRDVPSAGTVDEWDGSGWPSIDRLIIYAAIDGSGDRKPSTWPRSPVDPYALVILIPAYNDWVAVSLLLEQLDRSLAGKELHARVLLVDDGS